MAFGDCKVYNDGSHYIAIPYEPNPKKRKYVEPEEIIDVVEENETEDIAKNEHDFTEDEVVSFGVSEEEPKKKSTHSRKMTKKELFEELYAKNIDLKKSARKKVIVEAMLPYFTDKKATENYVTTQFERKERNLICRRTRLTRKVHLANFNYFCTFTYDDKKHTAESFKNKLRGCFKMMCHRKGWTYCGVWEKAPETKRLHFHGLFNIPDGAMPGELININDYDTRKHKRQETLQNTYFNERFGRSDFKVIDNESKLGDAISYLVKYIEKTGEKIVYSKGLPQYFISDIMDEDVICRIGQEDKKLLLFDDFSCWDEGEYIGQVSTDTIKKMRKAD